MRTSQPIRLPSKSTINKLFTNNAIMKTKLVILLFCLLSAGTASAQDSLKVTQATPQTSDILTILETMDIYLYRFDLKEFLNDTYAMNIYIDEYTKDAPATRYQTLRLGNNITSLDEVPEEHREGFRELKNIPADKNEWNSIEELSIYIRQQKDSTARVTFNIPKNSRRSALLKLKPVGKQQIYFYVPRPFQLKTVSKGEQMQIPLLLYGSGWVDTSVQGRELIRFCGESQIDPAMKADILKETPHYYVIGLELKLDVPDKK